MRTTSLKTLANDSRSDVAMIDSSKFLDRKYALKEKKALKIIFSIDDQSHTGWNLSRKSSCLTLRKAHPRRIDRWQRKKQLRKQLAKQQRKKRQLKKLLVNQQLKSAKRFEFSGTLLKPHGSTLVGFFRFGGMRLRLSVWRNRIRYRFAWGSDFVAGACINFERFLCASA